MDQREYDQRVERVLELPVAEVFLVEDSDDREVRVDAGNCVRLCNFLEELGIVYMRDLLYTPRSTIAETPHVGEKMLDRLLQGVLGAFADQQLWVDDRGVPWPAADAWTGDRPERTPSGRTL